MHTPQILPQFDNRAVKSETNEELSVHDDRETILIRSTPEDLSNIPKTSHYIEPPSNDLKNCHKPPIPLLPQPSIIYAEPIITNTTFLHVPDNDTNRSNANVRDKLKNIILSNSGSQIDKKRIKTESVPTIFIGSVPLAASTTSLLINSNSDNSSTFKKSGDEVTHPSNLISKISNSVSSNKRTRGEKTEASTLKVERNRAAARRYR